MSETAQPQDHELKPHGDELASALKPTSATTEKKPQQPAEGGQETKE